MSLVHQNDLWRCGFHPRANFPRLVRIWLDSFVLIAHNSLEKQRARNEDLTIRQ